MIPLNYHHMFYFWTAVKRGSITQASRDLYLTQPALSQQLKQLERSLKRELFTRGRGGIVLTKPGRIVFEHCERIFTEGEALSRSLRHIVVTWLTKHGKRNGGSSGPN